MTYVCIGTCPFYLLCVCKEPLPLHKLSMEETIVAAVQSLLLPQQGAGSPLSQPLPIHGSDATALPNHVCRVVAEIRTR